MSNLMKAKRKSDGIWIAGYYAKVRDYLSEEDIHVIIPEDAEIIPREGINLFEIIDESTLTIENQQEILHKLKEYSDTRLTPEQIEEMKNNNIALSEQLKNYQELEKQIEDIIREMEHYEVSNSISDPHPTKADYDAVAADKYQRIWLAISKARENNLLG